MEAYLDSSILLRVLFDQNDQLPEFTKVERGVSSTITRIECLRTIDRRRIRTGLRDGQVAKYNQLLFQILAHLELVQLSLPVLERAAQPFPTLIGTIDAIHLSSAVLWQQSEGRRLFFLSHDTELALAAEAVDFRVLGV